MSHLRSLRKRFEENCVLRLAVIALVIGFGSLGARDVTASDYCLYFSAGQYAEADTELIPTLGAFTVELWVYGTGSGTAYEEFISQGAQPGPFYLGTTAGSMILRAGDSWENTGVAIARGKWVHVAVTHSPSGNGVLYVDGIAVASSTAYGFQASGSPTRLGRQYGSAQEFFSGCLDEVKIWKTVRTPTQVSSDMVRGSNANDPDLVAYYDFNEAPGPFTVVQAVGRPGHPLALAKPVILSPIENINAVIESPSGGLSNCADGKCAAYFDTSVAIPNGFHSGFSWYSKIWPLVADPLDTLQLGLGSTWVNPNLVDLEYSQSATAKLLCEASTRFTPEFKASWGFGIWRLFQSIEGSLGYWMNTAFRSAMPKYRVNATPDCYQTEVSSPGWPWGDTVALAPEKTGLVQLSNRLLIPPDGLTFPLNTNGQLLGTAWMSLPFPKVGSYADAAPSGDTAWTLFINAANFKGPLVYWLPQFWSDLSQKDLRIAGLGLDAQPGHIGGLASEWGQIPMLEGRDTVGTLYSRIPQLQFPVDGGGRTVISQDLKAYSSAAAAAPFSNWLGGNVASPGGFSPAGTTSVALTIIAPGSYFQHGDSLTGISERATLAAFDGGNAYGFQWAASGSQGQFPSYFKQVGTTRHAVDESAVPASTGLVARTFQSFQTGIRTYSAPSTPDWWHSTDPALPGGTVVLTDGSTAEYKWYKFVDQPALQRLNLNSTDRLQLQNMIERMHQSWSTQSDYIAPPSSGELVSFDNALLVTPPAGMEKGYVPIVVRQSGNVVGPPLNPVNPGVATVVANPYGPISVQGGTLNGGMITLLQSDAVIQLGTIAGSTSSFVELAFQGFNIGAAHSLTIRSGASGQTVLLRNADNAASEIGGALLAQSGTGIAPPALVLQNRNGITVNSGANITSPSGLTIDALGSTFQVGSHVVNQGLIDGGSSLVVAGARVTGGGRYKGNAVLISTFGNANNPVSAGHFLSNGLQLLPSAGTDVALSLNGYGTSPQVFNVYVNGNANVSIPSAWPNGSAYPTNNAPVPIGGSRPAGVPEPSFGGGSMILQASGSLTLNGGITNDFVFPGGIVLKAGGTLNLNGVLVNQGWTTAGKPFQGVYFESPNIVGPSRIQVYSNNLNWVNFSTFPHAAVRVWDLTTLSNGSAAYMVADSTAPHVNTYSVLAEAAANGQCWTCLVNTTPVNMFGP